LAKDVFMKQRILLLSLLVITILCVYLFYTSYERVEKEQIDALNEQQLAYALLAKAGIESFADYYLQTMKHMARHDEIVFMNSAGERLIREFYEAGKEDIRSVTRVDANGKFLYTVPDPEKYAGTDISQREYFRVIKDTREPVVSDIITSAKGVERALAFNVPVIRDGVFRGSLSIIVSSDDLAAKYMSKIRIGETGYAWVLNSNGIEIYCPVPGHIGKSVYETAGNFPSVIPLAEEMMKGKQGVSTYSYDYVRGQKTELTKKHVVFAPIHIGNTLWSIAVAASEKEVLANMAGFRNRWLAITALLSLALFLSFYILSRTWAVIREQEKRKSAEEALRKKEETHRLISENIPVVVYSALPDEHSTITFISGKMERLTGYGADGFLENPDLWTDILHPDDRDSVWKSIREHRSRCDILDLEYRIITKSGEIKWIKNKAAPVLDVSGILVRIDGIMEDITGRKLAEEALRESFQRVEDIIDFLPDAVLVIDNGGRVIAWNRAMEEMTGVKAGDMLGKGNYEYALPFYGERRPVLIDLALIPQEEVEEKYLDINRQESILSGEAYIPSLRGSEAYLHGTASTLRDLKGNVVGAIEVIRDITSRRHAEELHKMLADRSQVGVYIVQEGRIVFVNPHIPGYSGFSVGELIGSRILDYVHPDDRETVRNTAAGMLKGTFSSPYEYRMIDREGKTRWLMETVTGIHYDRKPAILGNTMDITELKRSEEEKERLRAQLLQAQKMEAIGTLAGGIAHDFNNILMSIQGHTSLMLFELDTGHPYYERLSSIEELVRSGADLTRQILGFARGGRYEVRPVNLNDVIVKTAGMFGRTKREISIHLKIEENLRVVEADRGQIEQVLMNIYVNAWQAMPEGGDLYIETSNVALDEEYVAPFRVSSGDYIRISVTDTGVGMDEKVRQRIFEPFFTTKEMGRGTGLGLATVYGIIRGHKGMITVYSEKGKGTTFNIYFPASDKSLDVVADSPEVLVRGKETILIVDDEENILQLNRELLERLGYKAFTAPDGPEALKIFDAHKDEIALVILDMIMPEMSGKEVFRILKDLKPEVNVILSSGYSINGEAQSILGQGCGAFLQKPFTLGEVSKKIREVLDEK